MPATISVGGKGAVAIFTEFDAQGNKVPDAGTIAYTSSAPGVATVDSLGNCVAVSAGTSTIVGLDGTNSLTASDILTVTDVATNATLILQSN